MSKRLSNVFEFMAKQKKPNTEDQDSSRLRTSAAAVTDEGPSTCTPGLQVKTEETHHNKGNKAENNRKKLLPIVETIVLCGRQDLALKGSNDSGPLACEEPLHSDSNFRALLRFCARSGDIDLKGHLETAAINPQNISPQIQGELIEICGDKIVQKIVERCNASECFSVLVDETLDVSTPEQVSLSVRYVDVEAAGIREDFIGFVKISDMTGRGLADIILETLEKIGLNLQYLCGQGYDGAANLSGHISEAQEIISQKYTMAVCTHWSAHSLNLALSKTCNIPPVRNCQGRIASVCSFFRASSIRLELLKKNIKDSFPESRANHLLLLCETCWVERDDAVLLFVELYSVVVTTLEELKESPLQNSETSAEAWGLLLGVLDATFVVTIHILRKLLSTSLQLSKTLQRVDANILDSLQYVDLLLEKAREMRTESVKEFQEIFDTAKLVVEFMGGEVRIPPVFSRQTCENMQTTSPTPMEYYRLNVYIPFLDFFCSQLQERFTRHREVVQELQVLLPVNCGHLKSNFNKCTELYNECLQDTDTLMEEIDLWCRKWEKIAPAERPSNALEAYLVCNEKVFPNVKKFLQISATLPVSTATTERSFSTSESLKMYIRNTMGQERLTGLALLSVHRSLSMNPDFCQSVLTQFSSVSNRRYGILL